MKTKTKTLAATLVMVAAVSVLLYIPLTRAIQSSEDSNTETFNSESFEARSRRRPWLKTGRGLWLLNNSEPEVVNGTPIALFKDMLIVDTNDGQVRIHLPPKWTAEDEIVTREQLYENYLSSSENLTVQALRADVIDKEEISVYFLLGYEINDPVAAYAILHFNIEG